MFGFVVFFFLILRVEQYLGRRKVPYVFLELSTRTLKWVLVLFPLLQPILSLLCF